MRGLHFAGLFLVGWRCVHQLLEYFLYVVDQMQRSNMNLIVEPLFQFAAIILHGSTHSEKVDRVSIAKRLVSRSGIFFQSISKQ